jgi:hypothetical protein
MTTKFKARFDENALVPLGPVILPQDEILDIEVLPTTASGSAARILRAMHEEPHVSSEDVKELERLIDQGKLPVRYDGAFDDVE